MYIDENLHDDTDFLIAVSEVFTNILGNIKYYPYPSIVYKIAFNKYFSPQAAPAPIATAPAARPAPSTKPAPAKAEPQTEKSVPAPEPTSTPTAAPLVADTGSDDLLPKLLSKIEKASLKKSLEDHLIIDGVENGVVHLIVISKMTEMLLKKEAIITDVEKAFSEILGSPHHVDVKFQKKEDYFAAQLG